MGSAAVHVRVGAEAALSYQSEAGTNNVAYAGEDALQAMDIYKAATPSSPLVVLVHGGSWHSGDKSSTLGGTPQAEQLQAQGFAVFNINYRLSTTANKQKAFPREVEDVEKATAYAIAHAATYNANPNNVFLLTGSAGGNLCGSAALGLNAAKAKTVNGVCALSGSFDIVKLFEDYYAGIPKGGVWLKNSLPTAFVCSLETTCHSETVQNEAALWSPSRHLSAETAPVKWFLMNSEGGEEMPLDQAEAMKAALEAVGITPKYRILAGSLHAFAYWSKVESEIYAFLRT